MERLDETLDSFLKVRLQCNALLKVEEIIHIFTQICQGLLYLFKEKMVHMDLKTSNIMRDDNNIWKLIDYDTPVSGLIDQMIGTYQYMSPEYRDFEYDVNQSEELSLEFKMENDVWSLGVILYYMIYLEYPYFSQKKQKNNVNDSIYPIDPDKLFYKGFYISDKGKDLLMSIFQKPQKRIKLKEIMCHAFLNEIHQLNEVNCISKIPMIIRDNPMNLNSVLPTPFSKFNILWHDPNVFNEENKRYLDKYGKLFGITPFTDINQSQEFLSNAEDKWFVITSGTNCKKLIPLIHKNPSLIAIVIFCKTPDYFKELPSKYKKIIKIIHSSFETVLMNIQYYFNYYLCTYIFSSIDSNQCYVLTKMIRKQNEIPSRRDTLDDNNEENNENITVSYDLSTKFSIIINSVLKIKKITNSYDFTKIKEELFELSTFEEIKNMITARLDSKENSFQSIIFLYTCNPIYSSFNACLINDNYEKITEMLTYLFLSVLDKDNVKDKVISPGQVLYKGNKKNKSSDYRNNHTMFWETFSSTTESLNEAENNTNVNNDGTIFEIRLSKNLPHPHLKLLNGWNSFPKVKEVLLWPNFAFHTIAIRKEKWYEYIVLQQDEEYCILQPNLDNLRIWWGKYILDKVELPFCDFFKRLKFKIKDAADFNTFYQGNLKKIIELLKKINKIDELMKSINEMYVNDVKQKLLFDKDKQQNQKRLYDILTRDMNILKVLEDIWSPYLLEIVDVMWKLKDVKEIGEIFEQNMMFFNQLKNDVLVKVQSLIEIYQKACKKICYEFFENYS